MTINEDEIKSILILADTIHGEINRMCVTNQLAEFERMYYCALSNIDKLSIMIYNAKFKSQIGENNERTNTR